MDYNRSDVKHTKLRYVAAKLTIFCSHWNSTLANCSVAKVGDFNCFHVLSDATDPKHDKMPICLKTLITLFFHLRIF